MECKLCNTEMMIDEWNGWVWTCFHCDSLGRKATQKEIEKYENEDIPRWYDYLDGIAGEKNVYNLGAQDK